VGEVLGRGEAWVMFGDEESLGRRGRCFVFGDEESLETKEVVSRQGKSAYHTVWKYRAKIKIIMLAVQLLLACLSMLAR